MIAVHCHGSLLQLVVLLPGRRQMLVRLLHVLWDGEKNMSVPLAAVAFQLTFVASFISEVSVAESTCPGQSPSECARREGKKREACSSGHDGEMGHLR